MNDIDGRIIAAIDDPALAPTPLDAVRRRARHRSRRRDAVALTLCSVLAILGVASVGLGRPEPRQAGVGSSATGPLGLQGTVGSSQSCSTVGLDVRAAEAGVAFIGTPVSSRVEDLPDPGPDAGRTTTPPVLARGRVVWTFEVDVVRKGAAPRRVDVTVEWLGDDGRPLTPRDPTAAFAAERDRPAGFLATRVGRSTLLQIIPDCVGYGVPTGDLLALGPLSSAASVGTTAVAVAAIEPRRGDPATALAALGPDGRPIAYADGDPIEALGACPTGRRVVSVSTTADGRGELVVHDTATLDTVRSERVPDGLEPSGAWVVGCLDADGERIVVTQVTDRARVANRLADGSWSVVDGPDGVAFVVVLRDPEVVLLLTSFFGSKTVTAVDLATMTANDERPLAPPGDVVGAAADPNGTGAVVAVSNGEVPPNAEPSGGRILHLSATGEVTATTEVDGPLDAPTRGRATVFPRADGTVAVATGSPGLVIYDATGLRVGEEQLMPDAFERVRWVGSGRVWTALGSAALEVDRTAPGDDRIIWPFAASAVVGLPQPITIEPSAIDRPRPYDALDASFAAAVDLPRFLDARRSPLPVVVGAALLAVAASGVAVVLVRRRRRPAT